MRRPRMLLEGALRIHAMMHYDCYDGVWDKVIGLI